jgi:hypothetical protein
VFVKLLKDKWAKSKLVSGQGALRLKSAADPGSGFFLHPARGRLRGVALNPLPAICQFCETLDIP